MKNTKPDQMDQYSYEKKLWEEGINLVMGLDEVGRGCLAGPVVAAGVILKPNTYIEGITDSKLIKNSSVRSQIAEVIKSKAIYWSIKECSPEEIDDINILKASFLAMQRCVDTCDPKPEFLLVDGNRFSGELIPYQCIIKGDLKSASIGAASILAKVYRDKLMHKLHNDYPHYGWDSNVGYPTKKHYEGIKEFGITPWHRKSFKLGI